MSSLPAFVWVILLPLLAAPVVYLLGRVTPQRWHMARWLALLALLVAWVPFVEAARTFQVEGPAELLVGSIALRFDGVSLLLTAVLLTLATLVSLYSGRYMAGEPHEEKYHTMLIIMSAVIVGLSCAGDLFNLWLWFETMAVSSYLLVVFYSQQTASLEAGVKYVIQSAAGSVLVLLAIALVFAQTGTLDLAEMQATVGQMHGQGAGLLVLASGALFVIGFGVKVALVPLHTWLPDAHAQAPSGISAMLSAVVIEAGLVAMLRALTVLSGTAVTWAEFFLIFGALNMLVGNLLALRQTQVKRLLAFSSITHIGYMLLGLGIALYTGTAVGAQGSFFHLLSHGLMKSLAFLSAGALLFVLFTARGDHSPLTTADLSGAAQRYPLAALALSLALLGLGGLPPLVGFMSKWQILVAGAQTRDLLLIGLVVFAAVNSVISLGYYAPLVNAVYRQRPSHAVEAGLPMPRQLSIPLMLLTVAIVVIGIWPSLVNWLTEPAGSALMAAFGS